MTKPQAPKWRYFTDHGKRKREMIIATFRGEEARALQDDTAVIVSYWAKDKSSVQLYIQQELDI
jgi:hypothetical protein